MRSRSGRSTTDARLTLFSAATLLLVGVYVLVRADAPLQVVLGSVLLLAAASTGATVLRGARARRR